MDFFEGKLWGKKMVDLGVKVWFSGLKFGFFWAQIWGFWGQIWDFGIRFGILGSGLVSSRLDLALLGVFGV